VTSSKYLIITLALIAACGGARGVDPAEFEYDIARPLNFAEGEVFESPIAPNTEIHRVTFDGYDGIEVTGLYADPPEGPSDTAILLLHGVTQGSGVASADMVEPMRDWSCAGASTLAIDMPYARPDLIRFNAPFTLDETDRQEAIQLTVDLQRSVDLLAEQGAEKIAFVGISGGAVSGALFAGIERDVDGYAIILGNGGPVQRWRDFGIASVMLLGMPEAEIEEYAELMYPYSGIHFIGDANAPILFVNGRLDPIIGEDAAIALHEAAGDNAEVSWYDAGHDLPFDAFIEVHYWIGGVLGLDEARLAECEPIVS
jgi:predicted esterase